MNKKKTVRVLIGTCTFVIYYSFVPEISIRNMSAEEEEQQLEGFHRCLNYPKEGFESRSNPFDQDMLEKIEDLRNMAMGCVLLDYYYFFLTYNK